MPEETNFWPLVGGLVSWLKSSPLMSMVAISAVATSQAELARWRERILPPVPAALDEHWDRLGFDVADEGFLSGLSNCAFKDAVERAAIRAAYGQRLGSSHLFQEGKDADDFRIDCDARIPEHAPFFVFALYQFGQ